MKTKPADTPPAVDAVAIRNHWRSVVTAECLRCAALLNLVRWGETDMRKLPDHVYDVALRFCADLLERMCKAEIAAEGHRALRLEQQVAQELWNVLKPFAAKGEHYVGHLSRADSASVDLVSRGTQPT